MQLKMWPRTPVAFATVASLPEPTGRTRVIVLARGFQLALATVVHEGLAKIAFSSAFCGSIRNGGACGLGSGSRSRASILPFSLAFVFAFVLSLAFSFFPAFSSSFASAFAFAFVPLGGSA